MSELQRCLEKAGFANVRTVLGSGNVVLEARSASRSTLERRVEAAMRSHLDRVFATTIRSIDELAEMLASDPYTGFRLAPNSKRVVTLLHSEPATQVKLPIEQDGATLLCRKGTELFSAYVPSPKGPVFMNLIEKTFGKDLTTRTWDTIGKVVKAAVRAA